MLSVNTPVFYTTILIIFVIFSIKELTSPKKITKFAKWSSCFQEGIGLWKNSSENDGFWNHTAKISSSCKIVLDLSIEKLSESKIHVFPISNNSESVHLTIRVSEDIEAESKLKKVLFILDNYSFLLFIFQKSPQTLLFGTFPNSKQVFFRKIGKVFPVTIGMNSEVIDTPTNDRNETRNLTITDSESLMQLDLIYFLKEVLKHEFYISIWFNSIFEELPNMIYRNGRVDKNGITVCQMNLKINENEKTTAKKLLLNVINDRRYAVIVDQFDTFINMFLINFDNIKCKNELGIDR
ncbi:hypothetical protein CRE_26109 [Caenorhabditis remanei]|uniref:Uncharacterized protein n=1 Tax=Caenorhabditis remanei TaxID=31234 RepID=E3LQ88_CAERE|nr:hypothetical protein CRE_26109 [Caenorhabditis remanei]